MRKVRIRSCSLVADKPSWHKIINVAKAGSIRSARVGSEELTLLDGTVSNSNNDAVQHATLFDGGVHVRKPSPDFSALAETDRTGKTPGRKPTGIKQMVKEIYEELRDKLAADTSAKKAITARMVRDATTKAHPGVTVHISTVQKVLRNERGPMGKTLEMGRRPRRNYKRGVELAAERPE